MQFSRDELSDKWFEEGKEELDSLKPFWEAFENETDRAIGIVSACLLDSLLERLIKASYVKDPKVNSIFKDEHILQSFYTKINIAYFSGLIPKAFHHDLKLICDIRNKFAHRLVADLRFNDEVIVKRINRFSQIREDLVKIYPPKLRFELIVSHIAGLLLAWCQLLSKIRPANFVEMLKLEEKRFEELILTPDKVQRILESKRDN